MTHEARKYGIAESKTRCIEWLKDDFGIDRDIVTTLMGHDIDAGYKFRMY